MVRWLIWGVYVAVWTVALVLPVPARTGLPVDQLLVTWKAVIAKTLHVTAYAVLTLLSAWLRVPLRYRGPLMFFIAAHATLTELAQWGATEAGWSERSGMLYDVGFDHLGVLIGLVVGWKWWTRDERQ